MEEAVSRRWRRWGLEVEGAQAEVEDGEVKEVEVGEVQVEVKLSAHRGEGVGPADVLVVPHHHHLVGE